MNRFILVEDTKTQSFVAIPTPSYIPHYAPGTVVTAVVPSTHETHAATKEVEGQIVGIDIKTWWNKEAETIESDIIYSVISDDGEFFEVLQEEIETYYPETNDLENNGESNDADDCCDSDTCSHSE